MLFNSLEFIAFFIIFFLAYWYLFAKNLKVQNIFLLLSSYLFYGWWDWRFLSLIIASSVLDFCIGNGIHSTDNQKNKKLLLWISVFFNLGMLGFFKYFNFFADSLIQLLNLVGLESNPVLLNIILPVGISFYTFQTLGYTVDVYREKIKPSDNLIQFMCFVCFFPQLVAGPIERAKDLLHQFNEKRIFRFETAKSGIRIFLWGMFLKVVIGEICGYEAREVFSNYEDYNSSQLLLNPMFYIVHIYGDFAGYSFMAIGLARLLGFKLSQNFDYPFFSRNISELWQKWHISLNRWFTEYLYIPLGGNRKTGFFHYRNILLTFAICGFWHGAKWGTIVWGLIHGIHYVIWHLLKGERLKTDRTLALSNLPKYLFVFVFFSLSMVVFYFPHLIESFNYFKQIFLNLDTPINEFNWLVLGLLIGLFIIEGMNLHKEHPLMIERFPGYLRWTIYLAITFSILQFFDIEREFFYFQF